MSADTNVFQVAVGLAVGVGVIFIVGVGSGVDLAANFGKRIFDI